MVDMSEVESAAPALYGHIETVYSAMGIHSQHREVDGEDVLVWDGFTTRLFQSLGISVPYYGKVLQALQGMGCIVQLRRGGGATTSLWRLVHGPTRDRYDQYLEVIAGMKAEEKVPSELEQRIAALEARLPEGVDIAKALFDMQQDINRLKGGSDG